MLINNNKQILSHKDLLLITPPFIQINTAYPATPCLKGFLQSKGFEIAQLDLSIECIIKIFSSDNLQDFFNHAEQNKRNISRNAISILRQRNEYLKHIDAVINFLQSKDLSFAYAINNNILPKSTKADIQQDLDWHFGVDGIYDKARYFATLFLEELADFITECIDNNFGFSRYAEQICLDSVDFGNIIKEMEKDTLITDIMLKILHQSVKIHQPKVIAFSIPFPGNLLMAIKSAKYIKENFSEIKIVIGGGYVNTELRNLNEVRLFDFVDYVCLDDGELPLLKLLMHILHQTPDLKRTFKKGGNEVIYVNNAIESDFNHNETGIPDYDDLPLKEYISVTETTNPMHNLWSNGRWNKIALAHGCYWHKCSFCDTSLDYIKRFNQADVNIICERIEAIIKQTNYRGFHFVDEAAPPALLRKLANELINRKISISWWTNIRFETSFDEELCMLMAKSGCIAVSGGLEVASDRLLIKMNKGVNIEQVTIAANNLRQAGIMIHAYLMYGFPTQTEQETINSLEVVRQLFANQLINSAFWHRFAMTIHSPVGMQPALFEVERLDLQNDAFNKNGCNHIDKKGCKHQKFESGLKTALYNFIHENGFDFNLQDWFNFKIPQTTIPPNYIKRIIKSQNKNKLQKNEQK